MFKCSTCIAQAMKWMKCLSQGYARNYFGVWRGYSMIRDNVRDITWVVFIKHVTNRHYRQKKTELFNQLVLSGDKIRFTNSQTPFRLLSENFQKNLSVNGSKNCSKCTQWRKKIEPQIPLRIIKLQGENNRNCLALRVLHRCCLNRQFVTSWACL